MSCPVGPSLVGLRLRESGTLEAGRAAHLVDSGRQTTSPDSMIECHHQWTQNTHVMRVIDRQSALRRLLCTREAGIASPTHASDCIDRGGGAGTRAGALLRRSRSARKEGMGSSSPWAVKPSQERAAGPTRWGGAWLFPPRREGEMTSLA